MCLYLNYKEKWLYTICKDSWLRRKFKHFLKRFLKVNVLRVRRRGALLFKGEIIKIAEIEAIENNMHREKEVRGRGKGFSIYQ